MLNFPLTRRAFVAGTAALAAGGALTSFDGDLLG